MDPKQTPPQVGASSNNMGDSATGRSVFANAPNRFKDTNPKGDIIIPPSSPAGAGVGQSSKKPLIIAVVVALVVIVAIVVIALVSSGSRSDDGDTTSSGDEVSADVSAEVAEAFNKYANFIISGEASTERMPSKDELDGFLIVSKIIDKDMKFMDEAKQLFYDFYELFEELDAENYVLNDNVENYKSLFDVLYEYAKTGELPEGFESKQDAYYNIMFDCYKIEPYLYNEVPDTIVDEEDEEDE